MGAKRVFILAGLSFCVSLSVITPSSVFSAEKHHQGNFFLDATVKNIALQPRSSRESNEVKRVIDLQVVDETSDTKNFAINLDSPNDPLRLYVPEMDYIANLDSHLDTEFSFQKEIAGNYSIGEDLNLDGINLIKFIDTDINDISGLDIASKAKNETSLEINTVDLIQLNGVKFSPLNCPNNNENCTDRLDYPQIHAKEQLVDLLNFSGEKGQLPEVTSEPYSSRLISELMGLFKIVNAKQSSQDRVLSLMRQAISAQQKQIDALYQSRGGTNDQDLLARVNSIAGLLDNAKGQVLSASTSASTSSANSANQTISSDIAVTGNANLYNVAVTGSFSAGLLKINGFQGELETLATPLKIQPQGYQNVEVQNGKVVFDSQGNVKLNQGQLYGSDQFRGDITLEPGQTEIKVSKNWKDMPRTIILTPTFNTNIWYEKLEVSGFVIKVDKASTASQKISWLALW